MCEIAVTATVQSLPVVRERMRRWLAGIGWPARAADDIVLAVHEAVTNAVEHAYPDGGAGRLVEVTGVVESDVRCDGPGTRWHGGSRRVRVSIRDQGRWRADVHNRSDISRARGRGLVLMQAVTAEMTVTASATTGTTVVLLSESVARGSAASR